MVADRNLLSGRSIKGIRNLYEKHDKFCIHVFVFVFVFVFVSVVSVRLNDSVVEKLRKNLLLFLVCRLYLLTSLTASGSLV